MLLAFQLGLAIAVLGTVALFAALVAIVLFSLRSYEGFAQGALRRKYEGLTIHAEREPGDVVLIFHTYHGLIAWFTQTPHVVALPPADARKLLGRLLRFNLTWGILTYGGLLVPPLSVLNYIGQRRSITAQQHEKETHATHSTDEPENHLAVSNNDNPYAATQAVDPRQSSFSRPSIIRQIIGWTAAGLCALFSVNALMQTLHGKFDLAVAGVVLALLLGWAARDFLKHTTYGSK